MLEIVIHRLDESTLLLPLFLPLLRTLKKLQSSTVQSLQEGRALEQRLRSVVEQKVCTFYRMANSVYVCNLRLYLLFGNFRRN